MRGEVDFGYDDKHRELEGDDKSHMLLCHSQYPLVRRDDKHCIFWRQSRESIDGCFQVFFMTCEIVERYGLD